MNLWAIAAAALTAVTGLIHILWGGRDIARPLLASQELAFEPKMTTYYCWHMATIVIFGIAIAYLMRASSRLRRSLQSRPQGWRGLSPP